MLHQVFPVTSATRGCTAQQKPFTAVPMARTHADTHTCNNRYEREQRQTDLSLSRERSSRRMITAECNASEGEAAQRRKGCLLLLSLSLIEEKKVACLPASVSHSPSDFRRIRFLRVFTYALRQDT